MKREIIDYTPISDKQDFQGGIEDLEIYVKEALNLYASGKPNQEELLCHLFYNVIEVSVALRNFLSQTKG